MAGGEGDDWGWVADNYENAKHYIGRRIQLLRKVLSDMRVNEYYYFGLTYTIHIDNVAQSPIEQIRTLLGGNLIQKGNLYEVMQRVATLEDNKFFVNQQISTFKEYQSNGVNNPNLLDFSNSKLVAEGVSVSLDVNNRYAFLNKGSNTKMQEFDDDFLKIIDLIEKNMKKFE